MKLLSLANYRQTTDAMHAWAAKQVIAYVAANPGMVSFSSANCHVDYVGLANRSLAWCEQNNVECETVAEAVAAYSPDNTVDGAKIIK
jgi:hypothetical protein